MLLCILPVSYKALSQENSRLINGRVISPKNDVSNVLIINLNSKKSAITDSLGLFTIEAQLRDLIRFTSVQYISKEIVITDSIFLKNFMDVHLEENVIPLNEVIVTPHSLTGNIAQDLRKITTKPSITAAYLRLPQADVKVKTKNERLLLEADRGKFAKMQGSPFGVGVIFNIHKILNRISGKTKALKYRLVLDKNDKTRKQIVNLFSRKDLSEELGIPEIHIDNFLTFCLIQADFPKTSNALQVWEYFKNKSIEYKKSNSID